MDIRKYKISQSRVFVYQQIEILIGQIGIVSAKNSAIVSEKQNILFIVLLQLNYMKE